MKKKPIVRTAVSSVLIAVLLAVAIAVNIMLPAYNQVVSSYLGDTAKATLTYPDSYNDSLDLQYNKMDYTAEELAQEERRFNEEVVSEGVVLLKNEGSLPYASGTKFSFFSAGSATVMGNGGYDMAKMFGGDPDPGVTLKSAFEDRGFGVNETLWDFYWNGKGSEYRLGAGSVSWGDSEDFSINECPLSVLQGESGLLDSAKDTVPVFVLARKVGEGRDMPRSMYNHADNPEDQARSYLYTKTISAEDLAKLDSFDSLSPIDPATLTDTPVYGADNGHQLIELRGLAYDDPLWDDLLDQITPEEYQSVITQSGYGNPAMESIDKPFVTDQDAANGIASWMGHGDGYSFQSSMMLAQTWNLELPTHLGELIANQSFMGGAQVHGWYAPAMNIHRLPSSGRNGEYYSEDGYFSGAVAAATSRGAASRGMYTFVKHFVLNDQENHRGDRDGQFSMATWSNEQAIREIYLKPFEMCIANAPVEMNYLKSDGNGGYVNATTEIPAVNAIITSFNRIGYTWAGGCYPLMTNVLREEWGFQGFAITDNANTGLFMDAYQMIEAGGDAKLTNQPESARWTFDKDDSAHYHYAREAVHHILYSVVNSKAMNGLMPGVEYVAPMTLATKIQIAYNVVAAILVLALAWVIYRGWNQYKKQGTSPEGKQ